MTRPGDLHGPLLRGACAWLVRWLSVRDCAQLHEIPPAGRPPGAIQCLLVGTVPGPSQDAHLRMTRPVLLGIGVLERAIIGEGLHRPPPTGPHPKRRGARRGPASGCLNGSAGWPDRSPRSRLEGRASAAVGESGFGCLASAGVAGGAGSLTLWPLGLDSIPWPGWRRAWAGEPGWGGAELMSTMPLEDVTLEGEGAHCCGLARAGALRGRSSRWM